MAKTKLKIKETLDNVVNYQLIEIESKDGKPSCWCCCADLLFNFWSSNADVGSLDMEMAQIISDSRISPNTFVVSQWGR